MNKRIKKKHCFYGKIYLKQYHHHDEALPMTWFDMCGKIRKDLGHPIGKKRNPLERYFRRKYYWTEKQRKELCPQFRLKLKHLDIIINDTDFKPCFDSIYGGLVDDMTAYQETYEDAVILDYLEENALKEIK